MESFSRFGQPLTFRVPLATSSSREQLSVSSPRCRRLGGSETGTGGGSKRTEGYRGGELTPKLAPRRLGLLTPKLAIFYRISVGRGKFQGPLEIQNFHPPSNFFGDEFSPPLQFFRRCSSPGHNLSLRDEGGSRDQENHHSQHMLNQPEGSFSDGLQVPSG